MLLRCFSHGLQTICSPQTRHFLFIIIGFSIIALYYFLKDADWIQSYRMEQQERTFSIAFEATQEGAGLGNRLFEFVSFLGIAKLINRVPVVNLNANVRSIRKFTDIQKTFPKLIEKPRYAHIPLKSVKEVVIQQRGCCRYDIESLFNVTDMHLMGQGAYLQSYLYFSHMREELIDLFEPSDEAQDEVNEQLKELQIDGPVLCVHARRGDFRTAKLPMASRRDFTRFATEYLIKKDQPKTVLLFSSDLKWMEETFTGVLDKDKTKLKNDLYKDLNLYMPNIESPFTTLAMAYQRCDTVLNTASHSSFGWFMGFLAKKGQGKVYFSEHYAKQKGGLDKILIPKEYFLPDWIPLRMHNNRSFEEIRIEDIDPFPNDNIKDWTPPGLKAPFYRIVIDWWKGI